MSITSRPSLFRLMLLPIIFGIMYTAPVRGQDIEETYADFKQKLESPLHLSGSINASLGYNGITGSAPRIAPWMYRFIGAGQLDVLGVSIPAQLVYQSRNVVFNYTLPAFRFAGLSPRYKWMTLHLGDRNMELSPYTLSGHGFSGIGTALQPGRFRFKAMVGRLRRARLEDASAVQRVEPSFHRQAWGVQAGYEHQSTSVLLTLFKAWDDPTSIQLAGDQHYITPKENVVVSISGSQKIGSILKYRFEFARSALTHHTGAPVLTEQSGPGWSMGGLITPRIGTGYYWATLNEIEAATNIGTWSFGHERIAPGYETLGALFFNNDVERLTGNWRHQFMKNKLRINSRLGIERNNISDREANQYRRIIGSVQMHWQASDLTFLQGTYSNFNHTNRIRVPGSIVNPVDTIVLALINQQWQMQLTHRFHRESASYFSILMLWQQAERLENDLPQAGNSTRVWMSQAAYHHQQTHSNLNWQVAFLAQRNVQDMTEMLSLGPAANFNVRLLDDKLSISQNITWQHSSQRQPAAAQVFQMNNRIAYTLAKNQEISLNTMWVKRSSSQSFPLAFSEFRSLLQYGLRL